MHMSVSRAVNSFCGNCHFRFVHDFKSCVFIEGKEVWAKIRLRVMIAIVRCCPKYFTNRRALSKSFTYSAICSIFMAVSENLWLHFCSSSHRFSVILFAKAAHFLMNLPSHIHLIEPNCFHKPNFNVSYSLQSVDGLSGNLKYSSSLSPTYRRWMWKTHRRKPIFSITRAQRYSGDLPLTFLQKSTVPGISCAIHSILLESAGNFLNNNRWLYLLPIFQELRYYQYD